MQSLTPRAASFISGLLVALLTRSNVGIAFASVAYGVAHRGNDETYGGKALLHLVQNYTQPSRDLPQP
jgi:hypothetical protein